MTHTDQAHVADGMIIEWDVPIDMDDGLQLRADIFRPIGPGPYPVLLSHGPYAKGASGRAPRARPTRSWRRSTISTEKTVWPTGPAENGAEQIPSYRAT